MKRTLVLLLLATLPLPGVASCARDGRPLEVQLEQALADGLRKNDVKGASAALVLPDGRVVRAVSGVSYDDVPIQPDMLFAVGSIAVMINAFNNKCPNAITEELIDITVEHLSARSAVR